MILEWHMKDISAAAVGDGTGIGSAGDGSGSGGRWVVYW